MSTSARGTWIALGSQEKIRNKVFLTSSVAQIDMYMKSEHERRRFDYALLSVKIIEVTSCQYKVAWYNTPVTIGGPGPYLGT